MKKVIFFFIIMIYCVSVLASDLPRVAVYVTGNVGENEKRALGTQMLTALVNSGRYMGIERSAAFLAEIEREHLTQRSGAIDDNQISALGRQFGVKYICIADITPTLGTFQVSARIVDVETAEVVFIGSAFSPLRTGDDLANVSAEVIQNMFSRHVHSSTQQTVTPPLSTSVVAESLRDPRDGKTYRVVQMPDGKIWMAENLNYRTGSGSWCYDNNAANCNVYGRLYDWNTAMTVCPAGWRLPSAVDWDALTNVLGGREVAGTILKSVTGWSAHPRAPTHTDDYGFSALPGGNRQDGRFHFVGLRGYWWSTTGDNAADALHWRMTNSSPNVSSDINTNNGGFSVRCVRD